MITYDPWFPRYALRNRLMFFCRLFLPAVGRGSSALSDFLSPASKGLIKGTDICPCPPSSLPLAQFKIIPHFFSQISNQYFLRKIVILQISNFLRKIVTFFANW